VDEGDEDLRRKKKEKKEKEKAKLKKHPTPPLGPTAESPPAAAPFDSPGQPAPQTFPPSKRRSLSRQLPIVERRFTLEPPEIVACRQVDVYQKLNHIEEGTYGVVYRARERATGDIVALKMLKLEREKNGFPVTSLREISTLMAARHPNIVNIREIVLGDTLSQLRHRFKVCLLTLEYLL